DDRILAASRLWRRLAGSLKGPEGGLPATGLVAVGGFAYRPDRDPRGAWSGFPALLLRVPALAVTRTRGRTFTSAFTPDAEALLEAGVATGGASVRAPSARRLDVAPVRNPVAWTAAVGTAAARLRAGAAEKV